VNPAINVSYLNLYGTTEPFHPQRKLRHQASVAVVVHEAVASLELVAAVLPPKPSLKRIS
jgi:hypothetical protein